MVYVALLRGINVGGNNRVEMFRLKAVFESLGFADVLTYINSGNVVFSADRELPNQLAEKIRAAIEAEFGFKIPVVVRDKQNLETVHKAIPASWVNDSTMKTDVLFLWESHDKAELLDNLAIRPEIEDVKYVPGAIVWRIDKVNATKSGLLKIIGTELYRNVTIRNVNTLRKLVAMMAVV